MPRKIFIFLLIVLGAFVPAQSIWANNLRHTPVVQVVKKVSPAVVNVYTTVKGHNPFEGFAADDDFFRFFFGNQFPLQQRQRTSLGSGVIIDGKQRLVLTNSHVIEGGSSIIVRLNDGREFTADLVGSGPDVDLAVLKLQGTGILPQVDMGQSADLMIGEDVIAIGNPYGYSHTVTRGVISALDRTIPTKKGTYTGFIQTDAAINPGNSGGPLLNIEGRLIGINTAIQAGAEGIGFAIPIDKAKRVITELIQTGHVETAWFGINGQNINQRMAAYFRLQNTNGILIRQVYPDTPAQKAGIKPGDILLRLGSVPIREKGEYLDVLRGITQGQKIKWHIWRQGQKQEIVLQSAAFKDDYVLELLFANWGFTASPGSRNRLVLSRLRDGGVAQRVGLAVGDKILQVAGVRLHSVRDLIRAFKANRMQDSTLLVIERRGQTYYARLGSK